VTLLGFDSTTVGASGEPVVLPIRRTVVVQPSEFSAALALSPRIRVAHAAAWPLFFVAIAIGFLGAHFGRPSHAVHALAVACVLIRFVPSIRAQCASEGHSIVQRLTVAVDAVRIDSGEAHSEWLWARVSYYETPLGLVVVPPGRSTPCLAAQRCFTPAEYAVLVDLARRQARRTSPALGMLLAATLVLLIVWLGWRTWFLEA
jgi:hypothetical protein